MIYQKYLLQTSILSVKLSIVSKMSDNSPLQPKSKTQRFSIFNYVKTQQILTFEYMGGAFGIFGLINAHNNSFVLLI